MFVGLCVRRTIAQHVLTNPIALKITRLHLPINMCITTRMSHNNTFILHRHLIYLNNNSLRGASSSADTGSRLFSVCAPPGTGFERSAS